MWGVNEKSAREDHYGKCEKRKAKANVGGDGEG